MACNSCAADYLCEGRRQRAAAVRKRDGGRCRGCNRDDEEVRLEVHHRVYGTAGACGQCVLTGVDDNDLTTLCIDCHDAVTSIRRRVRYVCIEITADTLDTPQTHPSTASPRHPVDADEIAAVTARAGYSPARASVW
jgi:hypothetical protein